MANHDRFDDDVADLLRVSFLFKQIFVCIKMLLVGLRGFGVVVIVVFSLGWCLVGGFGGCCEGGGGGFCVCVGLAVVYYQQDFQPCIYTVGLQ